MRYTEIITPTGVLREAPQAIDPTQFGLDDPAYNHQFAARLMKRVAEIIDDTPDSQLIRTGNLMNGWIMMYDKQDQSAVYAIQYQTRHWRLLPTTVTQCVLWRKRGSVLVRDITRRVFFDYLLKKFPAIMSDALQTSDGNGFWIDRMGEAVARGLRVGIVTVPHRQIDWLDPGQENLHSWLARHRTYGPESKLQGIRYIILA